MIALIGHILYSASLLSHLALFSAMVRQTVPGQPNQTNGQQAARDEIQSYLDARYVSAVEACWRIFELPMHEMDPKVERLPIHLKNEQTVRFEPDDNLAEVLAAEDDKDDKLTAFFKLCDQGWTAFDHAVIGGNQEGAPGVQPAPRQEAPQEHESQEAESQEVPAQEAPAPMPAPNDVRARRLCIPMQMFAIYYTIKFLSSTLGLPTRRVNQASLVQPFPLTGVYARAMATKLFNKLLLGGYIISTHQLASSTIFAFY